jgi:kumamolisin
MFQPVALSLPPDTITTALLGEESVAFVIALRRPASLEEFAQRVIQREVSYLSYQDFCSQFAARDTDIWLVQSWLELAGLSVDSAHSASATLRVSGSAAAVNQLLGIQLVWAEVNGSCVRTWTGEVSVPNSVESVIDHIANLSTAPPYERGTKVADSLAFGTGTAVPLAPITPVQAARAYAIPTTATGAGQTIGIVQYGGGYNQQNVTDSFAAIGLPTPVNRYVLVDGQVNSTASNYYDGYSSEVMLDLFVAGSVANSATIVTYFGGPITTSTGAGPSWADPINAAIHDIVNNPSVISISYGAGENSWYWTTSTVAYVDSVLVQSVALGITLVVATGDSGAGGVYNNSYYTVQASYPATSPWVLAVGGTTLQLNTSGTIYSETVWGGVYPGYGSGGGISIYEARPSWQAGLVYSTATYLAFAAYGNGSQTTATLTARGIPDVAANADPASGYTYFVGTPSTVVPAPVGGTSAAAPLWAGLIAGVNQLTNTRTGFINQALYQNPGVLNDVTSGNNADFTQIGYGASTGWDACTGLGTPNGQAIISLLGAGTSISQLSNLTVSQGLLAPFFNTRMTSYSVSVSSTVTSITVTPTTTSLLATVTVNGVTVTSGTASGAIPLTVGNNEIDVAVTAENGINTTTYVVNVACGAFVIGHGISVGQGWIMDDYDLSSPILTAAYGLNTSASIFFSLPIHTMGLPISRYVISSTAVGFSTSTVLAGSTTGTNIEIQPTTRGSYNVYNTTTGFGSQVVPIGNGNYIMFNPVDNSSVIIAPNH